MFALLFLKIKFKKSLDEWDLVVKKSCDVHIQKDTALYFEEFTKT